MLKRLLGGVRFGIFPVFISPYTLTFLPLSILALLITVSPFPSSATSPASPATSTTSATTTRKATTSEPWAMGFVGEGGQLRLRHHASIHAQGPSHGLLGHLLVDS
ncbi:unnamed protein product [Clonostachys byssicola]|uniref:Uncharacterized protein n=1 Tax=Clonostachys byssicola TaxID=160290 RepID=A0A9N9Y479_9HYPO|nr:unnamed protein product [Clonostachys byssicola]